MDKMKNKNKNIYWIIPLIIFATLIYMPPFCLAIYGIFTDIDKFEIKDNGTIEINNNKLTILNNTEGIYYEKEECYIVEGILVNNEDREYDSIDITYSFYDKEGYILGNSNAYVQSLKGNNKWKFKVNYCGPDSKEVGSFEFIDVNTY